MKKLLILLICLIPALLKAQNTVTLESGTSPLTSYQFRYKAITPDSLNHLWMFWNGKYNRIFTGTEINSLLNSTPQIFNNSLMVRNVNGTLFPITGIDYQGSTFNVLNFSTTKIQTAADFRALSTIHFPNLISGSPVGLVGFESDGKLVIGNGGLTGSGTTFDYPYFSNSTALTSNGFSKIAINGSFKTVGFGIGVAGINDPSTDNPHMVEINNDNGTQQMLKITTAGPVGGSTPYQNNVHWNRFDGTYASPTNTKATMFFMSMGFRGYDSINGISQSAAAFQSQTLSDWSSTSHPIRFNFDVTDVGSITRNSAFQIRENSDLWGGTNFILSQSDKRAWNANYRTITMASDVGIRSRTTGSELTLFNNLYFDSTWKYATSNIGSYLNIDDAGNLIYATAPSGTAGATVTPTTKFSVNINGSTVVGNSLAVNGNLAAVLPAYSSGTNLSVVYNSTNGRFETATAPAYLALTAGSGSPLTGDLYINKATPTIFLTNTVSSNKQWSAGLVGTSYVVNETGVDNRLIIAAGGTTTINGHIQQPTTLDQGSASVAEFYNVNANGSGLYIQSGGNTNYSLSVNKYDGTNALTVLGNGTTHTVNFFTTSVTPSISAGAAAGSGATASIVGNNQDGIITIVLGTSPATGTLCTVTMSGSFAYPTKCTPVITEESGSTFSLGLSVVTTNGTSTTWSVQIGTAALGAGTVKLNYHNGGY